VTRRLLEKQLTFANWRLAAGIKSFLFERRAARRQRPGVNDEGPLRVKNRVMLRSTGTFPFSPQDPDICTLMSPRRSIGGGKRMSIRYPAFLSGPQGICGRRPCLAPVRTAPGVCTAHAGAWFGGRKLDSAVLERLIKRALAEPDITPLSAPAVFRSWGSRALHPLNRTQSARRNAWLYGHHPTPGEKNGLVCLPGGPASHFFLCVTPHRNTYGPRRKRAQSRRQAGENGRERMRMRISPSKQPIGPKSSDAAV